MKNKPAHKKVTQQTKETLQTNLDYISENVNVSAKGLFNRGCVAG